jgi:hypothetical protein
VQRWPERQSVRPWPVRPWPVQPWPVQPWRPD